MRTSEIYIEWDEKCPAGKFWGEHSEACNIACLRKAKALKLWMDAPYTT